MTRAAVIAATPPETNVTIAKMACGLPVFPGKRPTPSAPSPSVASGIVTRPTSECAVDEPRARRDQQADERHRDVEDRRRRLEDDTRRRPGPAKVTDLVRTGRERPGVERLCRDDAHEDGRARDDQQAASEPHVGRPDPADGGGTDPRAGHCRGRHRDSSCCAGGSDACTVKADARAAAAIGPFGAIRWCRRPPRAHRCVRRVHISRQRTRNSLDNGIVKVLSSEVSIPAS